MMIWSTPQTSARPARAVTTLTLLVGFFATAAWPSAMAAADSAPSKGAANAGGFWRFPERDAANCLYFLMRFHDHPVSYDQVVAALPGPSRRASLSQVRDAARKLGFDCGVYDSGGADLLDLNQPAIIYMEQGGIGQGSFFVLVSTYEPSDIDKEGAALLFSGGMATLRRFPIDEFRRGWSGHLLIARGGRASSRWSGIYRVAALSAATVLAVLLMASRSRQPAPAVPKLDDPSSKREREHHVS